MKKFALGQLVMTRAVQEKMKLDPYFAVGVLVSLHRYCAGDWGDLCEGDKAENEKAIKEALNNSRLRLKTPFGG